MALTCYMTTRKMSLQEYSLSTEARDCIEISKVMFEAEDGLFSFLDPYFNDFQKKTNIFIDLYGDAYIFDTDLEKFIETIYRANRDLENYINEHPNENSIYSSSAKYPNDEVILEKVDIKKLQSLINTLLQDATRAYKIQGGIMFFGD